MSESKKISEIRAEYASINEQLKKELNNVKKSAIEIDEMLEKVSDSYGQLFGVNGSDPSNWEEVLEILESVETLKESKNEIIAAHEKIMGADGEKGLVRSIESSIRLKTKKMDELIVKINSLLPQASTVGLVASYSIQRRRLENIRWIWVVVFTVTIIALVWFGVVATKGVDFNSFTLEKAWLFLLTRLPVIVPLFWLASFASKRQSQNSRLAQEYAHKEAMARSFVGFKKEMEANDPNDDSKYIEFMKSIIEMAGENPSKTLAENSHNDNGIMSQVFASFSRNKTN